MIKKINIFFVLFFVFLSSSVFAISSSTYIEGPWISQLSTLNQFGTSWEETMTCGPVSLQMGVYAILKKDSIGYQDLKNQVDWMHKNKLVPYINDYNLVKYYNNCTKTPCGNPVYKDGKLLSTYCGGSDCRVYDPGTYWTDLIATGAYYFGLWNLKKQMLIV